MRVTLRFRVGLLDLVKQVAGFKSEREFGDALGVSRETLRRVRNGDAPSADLIASVAVMANIRDINRVVETVRAA